MSMSVFFQKKFSGKTHAGFKCYTASQGRNIYSTCSWDIHNDPFVIVVCKRIFFFLSSGRDFLTS